MYTNVSFVCLHVYIYVCMNMCILILSCVLDVTGADDCASHPCLNNAVCLDGVGMFMCSCSSGYRGLVCEEG